MKQGTVKRFEFSAYGERFSVASDIDGAPTLYDEVFPEARNVSLTQNEPIPIRMRKCTTHLSAMTNHTIQTVSTEEAFTLSVDDHQAVELSTLERSVVVRIDPTWLQNSRDLVRSLLIEAPVLVSLTLWRMLYLHAAAVAWGKQGFILAGSSGTGKSSLAYACSKMGFDFVAEDYLFLSRGRNGIMMHGSPASLRLCPSALAYFPELGSLPIEIQPNGEHKLDAISSIPPSCRRFHVPLSQIFLLSGQAEPEGMTLSRVVRGTALQDALVAELMFDREGTVRRYGEQLAELAAFGAERVFMADSPAIRAEYIRQQVAAS
jgi:hypothetical protein